MFKTKAKKDSSKAQTPAPTQNEGPYKNPEVNKAVKYFKQICKHRKVDAIDKHDFKMLISKVSECFFFSFLLEVLMSFPTQSYFFGSFFLLFVCMSCYLGNRYL